LKWRPSPRWTRFRVPGHTMKAWPAVSPPKTPTTCRPDARRWHPRPPPTLQSSRTSPSPQTKARPTAHQAPSTTARNAHPQATTNRATPSALASALGAVAAHPRLAAAGAAAAFPTVANPAANSTVVYRLDLAKAAPPNSVCVTVVPPHPPPPLTLTPIRTRADPMPMAMAMAMIMDLPRRTTTRPCTTYNASRSTHSSWPLAWRTRRSSGRSGPPATVFTLTTPAATPATSM